MDQTTTDRRYSLHGVALQVRCALPWLGAQIDQMLGGFEEEEWPAGFSPVMGLIEGYDQETVATHLSPAAVPLSNGRGSNHTMEVYQEQERFWVVDDRWGMAELNMLKGQWRSWLLPRPSIEPELCLEAAVLWPLAQLMRGRGLHLLPAVSLVRDDWGVLIFSPCTIEPELRAMISAGFKVIGQRWSALREEEGRVGMLYLPGEVERLLIQRGGSLPPSKWTDLEREYCGIRRNHGFCQTVLMIEPGRRARANLKDMALGSSVLRLRQAWPIFELHPQRPTSRLAVKLARTCRCWDVQLSTEPRDLLDLLPLLKRSGPMAPARSRVAVALAPHLADRAQFLERRREAV